MKYNLYSIKDKKSDFAAPVPIADDNQAKRWFDNQVKTTPFLNTYPEDFDLYKIGTFDSESGIVDKGETPFPEYLASAEEVINNANKKTEYIPNNDRSENYN